MSGFVAILTRAWRRSPRALQRIGWKFAHELPTALAERLLALAAGRAYSPPPPPVDVPSTATRLFIAPANYAGQAWAWARAVERFGTDVGARNMAPKGGFGYPADCTVPKSVLASRPWQRRQGAAIDRFTHVLVEAELPILPRAGVSAEQQIRMLQDRGIRVATLSHGSDVRSPTGHAARDPWSPFHGQYPGLSNLQAAVDRNLALLETLRYAGIPAFVSTPDLLVDVPWATWLPVVVDPADWVVAESPLRRTVPVVVHAPSNGALKGTDLVEPVLRALDAEGLVEYRAATGVDRRGMRELYRNADIVLEQFRMGIYGVATCEAMAAGRVVISHVSAQSRSAAQTASGAQLPVIEATGDTLRGTILEVLEDRDGARDVASRGPGFIRSLHDGRVSAEALAQFLNSRPR